MNAYITANNINTHAFYTRRVLLLIGALSILRFIVASTVELGNDESYYWLYSKVLKWNYFDHPPMIAVWIRIFTANLLLENHVGFLRLGSVVGCGMATWFMYKCVSTLKDERAGWFAACLYNASYYAGITAGLFVMPDTPQMVFYTFCLWMIARISVDDKDLFNWILFGIGSGLCIMSKVHGVFIWIGLGLYILLFKRTWLANFRMYVAAIIALIIISPILLWNIKYDFVTYHFNSQRIIVEGFSRNWYNFLVSVVAQLAINNPFNTVFIIITLVVWRGYNSYSQALRIFNFIGIPFALILLYIALYRLTLPHWSGPAYVALLPLASIRLAEMSKRKIFPNFIKLSLGTYILFMIAAPLFINYYPGNFGSKSETDMGKGDLTLDMYGWKEAGAKFDSLYQKEISTGIIPSNTPVVCTKWWGAHTEYYFCRPMNIQMIGLGNMNDLHEYSWMNRFRKDKVNLSSAYCIMNSDDYFDVHWAYKNYYSRIDTAAVITIMRGNKPAHNFYVFRLSGWKGNLFFE